MTKTLNNFLYLKAQIDAEHSDLMRHLDEAREESEKSKQRNLPPTARVTVTPARNPAAEAEASKQPATFISFWHTCGGTKEEDQRELKRERIATMTNVSVSLGLIEGTSSTMTSALVGEGGAAQ